MNNKGQGTIVALIGALVILVIVVGILYFLNFSSITGNAVGSQNAVEDILKEKEPIKIIKDVSPINEEIFSQPLGDCLNKQRENILLYISQKYPDIDELGIMTRNLYRDDEIFVINCYNMNRNYCDEMGIKSFPTWIINGKKFERDVSESELREYSNC